MALPFDLPLLSAASIHATSVVDTGMASALAAGRRMATLLGRPVDIRGRATAGRPSPRAAARVPIDLTAVPAVAVLEVEPALVVRIVDVLAGGAGEAPADATKLTPLEASALELLALAAVDGACSIEPVERALAPRVARAPAEPRSGVGIELEVEVGHVRGRARLLLPEAALRLLRRGAEPSGAGARIEVPASYCRGKVALATEELDALAPGDVVLVDPPHDGRDSLVFPGGLRAVGSAESDAFHVEDVVTTGRHLQLPIPLDVELARVDVPLAELARLEPGSVLPLPIDRRGLVTLRCSERAIARGEIVDVDGALGVRILSVEVAS